MARVTPEDLGQVAGEIVSGVDASALLETIVTDSEATLVVDKRAIVAVLKALREDARTALEMLSDVTAVDYLEVGREPRFDVVYHVFSLRHAHRLALQRQVWRGPRGTNPP